MAVNGSRSLPIYQVACEAGTKQRVDDNRVGGNIRRSKRTDRPAVPLGSRGGVASQSGALSPSSRETRPR